MTTTDKRAGKLPEWATDDPVRDARFLGGLKGGLTGALHLVERARKAYPYRSKAKGKAHLQRVRDLVAAALEEERRAARAAEERRATRRERRLRVAAGVVRRVLDDAPPDAGASERHADGVLRAVLPALEDATPDLPQLIRAALEAGAMSFGDVLDLAVTIADERAGEDHDAGRHGHGNRWAEDAQAVADLRSTLSHP